MYRDNLFYNALSRFMKLPKVKAADETLSEVLGDIGFVTWRVRAYLAIWKLHGYRVSPLEVRRQYGKRFSESAVHGLSVLKGPRADVSLTELEEEIQRAIDRTEKRNAIVRKNQALCAEHGHIRTTSIFCDRCSEFLGERRRRGGYV